MQSLFKFNFLLWLMTWQKAEITMHKLLHNYVKPVWLGVLILYLKLFQFSYDSLLQWHCTVLTNYTARQRDTQHSFCRNSLNGYFVRSVLPLDINSLHALVGDATVRGTPLPDPRNPSADTNMS